MDLTFRQYEIQEKLGSGGMASVYKGRHTSLGSPVAIKILHRELAFDEVFISRFEIEARSAASIQNPNIVKVLDYGSEAGVYFIVMEYVDGRDLSQILETLTDSSLHPPVFPTEICLLLLHDAAFGLQAAHEMGIFHRDIKPSNLLLDKHGLLRITDFGLARETGQTMDMNLTRTGTILGTPSYMSPEQAAGESLDHRSDIFSLGVVAYQLLTGHRPFIGQTASEVLQQIIEVDPPSLVGNQAPWLTSEIQGFIDKCLQKDQTKRFADMEQVLKAIRDCQKSLDPTGRIALEKYQYLVNFASDPVGFSEKMYRENAKRHLQRGLRFQDMGITRLEDALIEFKHVVALDPENRKAKDSIRALEKKAKKLGVSNWDINPKDGEGDFPTVFHPPEEEPDSLPQASEGRKPALEGQRKRSNSSRKSPIWVATLFATSVIVFASYWAISWWQGSGESPIEISENQVEDPRFEDTASDTSENQHTSATVEGESPSDLPLQPDPGEIDESKDLIAVVAPDENTDKDGTTDQEISQINITPDTHSKLPQKDLQEKIHPINGVVQIEIEPAADIYLDGNLAAERTNEYLVTTEQGRHILRLQNDEIYFRREIPIQVSGGDTLRLNPPTNPLGTLQLGTNARMAQVEIDGFMVPNRWPIIVPEIVAGEHTITVRLSGAPLDQVTSILGQNRERLEFVEMEKGVWIVPVVITQDENKRIQLKFEINP